ncbi:MAG: hypothetical protein FD163_1869 [Hyphomonadaceae bacterium]|nr:MAG: hypothetical protein FD128_2167 [Hyphomonadaceae bacterium]KAF0184295.1 MAG: hypothetical protein FD163_1869 [Hyphomonadaceae bacterium]
MTLDPNSISLAALIVSAIAIIASIYSALRQEHLSKTEIKLQRDTDLLKWGADCVRILQEMIEFTFRIQHDTEDELAEIRTNLLSEVSVLIDIGRWYLPNLINSNQPHERQAAYKGYRPIAIDALLYSYRVFKSFDFKEKDRVNDLRQYLVTAKREFVSQIQTTVDPARLMAATGEKPNYPKWMHPKELLPKRYQDDGAEQ